MVKLTDTTSNLFKFSKELPRCTDLYFYRILCKIKLIFIQKTFFGKIFYLFALAYSMVTKL